MSKLAAQRERVTHALEEARKALGAFSARCDWRVATEPPADPIMARPDTTDWPKGREWFRDGDRWQAGDNWLYATITVPEESAGVFLEGSPASIFLSGWHPFSLYVDGRLIAQEERVWLATDKGLISWDRRVRYWGRVAVGGLFLDKPVVAMSFDNGILSVTIEATEGHQRTFAFDTTTERWREVKTGE